MLRIIICIVQSRNAQAFSVFVVLTGVPLTAAMFYAWIERLLRFTTIVNRKLYDAARRRRYSSLTAKVF